MAGDDFGRDNAARWAAKQRRPFIEAIARPSVSRYMAFLHTQPVPARPDAQARWLARVYGFTPTLTCELVRS